MVAAQPDGRRYPPTRPYAYDLAISRAIRDAVRHARPDRDPDMADVHHGRGDPHGEPDAVPDADAPRDPSLVPIGPP